MNMMVSSGTFCPICKSPELFDGTAPSVLDGEEVEIYRCVGKDKHEREEKFKKNRNDINYENK